MEVFEQEVKDGLGDILSAAQASFAFETSINDTELFEKILKSQASIEDTDQLYPIKTVLVSTGWNANDDVFLKEETWFARHTPEDKPINSEHNELEIIGHMTANYCVDNDGKTIADSISVEEIPDNFHIITDGVLYKEWKHEEKKKLIANIISRIQNRKGRVSMECFFTGFDYAVIKDNKQYLIARTQETAFLTKFLKIYGGSGVYDGCRIGRALRNISFSGKGIVTNPANPNSIIITDSLPFKGVASVIKDVLGEKQRENLMSKEIELETKVAERDKVIAGLEAKVADLTKVVAEADNKSLKSELDSAKAELTAKVEEVNILNQKISANEVLVNEFKAKLEASEKLLTEANDNLNKIKEEQIKLARISQLKNAGLDEEAAVARYQKFAALSDDMFAEVVSLVKQEPKKEEKQEVTASQVIDGAEKGKEVSLATQVEKTQTKTEKAQADLANFASKILSQRKNKGDK